MALFSEINRLKNSHLIGIQDSVECRGNFLMTEFIRAACEQSEIHIVCTDRYHHWLKEELANVDNSNIQLHHHVPKFGVNQIEEDASKEDTFEKLFLSLLPQSPSKKCIIIVDSLSTVILTDGLEEVYRLMNTVMINSRLKCGNAGKLQIMLMVHEDVIPNASYALKQLKHICRVWIRVRSTTVDLTIRRSRGKVTNEIFEYKIDEKDKLMVKKAVSHERSKDLESEIQQSSTFKLTLSKSEKEAKDAVKLPYEKSESNEFDQAGKIIYEPDELDDWDEEDPDNDLEFT